MSKSRLAVVALLLGIFAFVNLLGLEKGLMAVVVGWLALAEIKETPGKSGKGLAWAGIILGLASLTLIAGILLFKGPEILKYLRQLHGVFSR